MNVELVSGKFKSFHAPFDWKSIPEFAVITGPNGAGKTQLLSLLHAAAMQNTTTLGADATVKISDTDIRPHDVAPMTDWGLGNAEVSPPGGVGTRVTQMVNWVQNTERIPRNEPFLKERVEAVRAIVETKLGKKAGTVHASEVAAALPDAAILRDWIVGGLPGQIATLFHNRQLARVQLRATGRSESEIDKELGDPPWRVLNELLSVSGLPYRLTTPEDLDIRLPFELRLEDTSRGVKVDFGELSRGETAIVSLYLWLYTSREHNFLPRLVLLDEPDAHLHPAMVRGFLDALHGVLVKKHGCQVIMTTHRPDTVAVSPPGTLFEMFRDNPRIVHAASKEATLGRLCASLFTVIPGARSVIVEDTDDVQFYNLALRTLRELDLFPPAITPVFIPASTGEGESKISGGASKVSAWVEKLQACNLGKLVQGLIDKDQKNAASDHVHVLSRYSIENYLVDPLVVFAALVDAGQAPDISPAQTVRRGDEASLGSRLASELQPIVEAILALVEPQVLKMPGAIPGRVEISFTSGLKLQYPQWLLNMRGKDLLQRFHAERGVTHKSLLSALERVHMVPNDLVEVLRKLI